ncbi:uncharacterized protein LOC115827020 [Chanos chanos]|uniref:Uncharacterized protein LOC115827020 n=1 Tax=Chanos chanos TaxID=29144 RepID=A0A6J2WMR1_CHACN|nr:uncharacterized protein LOC115827020 [Chanos chanos]
MAALKARNILITGANRGLGLEMVRQLVEIPYPNRQIFACCRDPDGPKSKDLRELAEKHPKVIKIIRLDVADANSIREAAKKVGSLLEKNGLNLLVNNAGVVKHTNLLDTSTEDMWNIFDANVMGPFTVTKEFIPYLRTAVKASGTPGMSCDKAAVINVSTYAASLASVDKTYPHWIAFPYNVTKTALNMMTVLAAIDFKPEEILFTALHPGWVKTELGGEGAMIGVRESIEGMLHVMSGLTEKQNGAYMDYTGKTLPW